ncbi:MAG: ribosome assembly RNA-binding protein YhbY [Pseudomonadota bacterium]
MDDLKGFQKKYLRELAHHLKPVVLVGQRGLSGQVLESINQALDDHELIKIKFLDAKEKEAKSELSTQVVEETGARVVGMVGHTVILYRPREDPAARKIQLPRREN